MKQLSERHRRHLVLVLESGAAGGGNVIHSQSMGYKPLLEKICMKKITYQKGIQYQKEATSGYKNSRPPPQQTARLWIMGSGSKGQGETAKQTPGLRIIEGSKNPVLLLFETH